MPVSALGDAEHHLVPDSDENNDCHEPNERSTLLPHRSRTPLPKLQIAMLMILQIAEPLMSHSIYPYINQLIDDLGITGGDSRKVGFYAGLLESLFFVTQALSVLQWSRASGAPLVQGHYLFDSPDFIGRKPILLIGLFGASISTISFGLSRSFLGLVISRCICGALNGNVGVMKSVIADITDPSNRAEGFGTLPVVWAVGLSGGALLGGSLAYPAGRFPGVFSSPFWEKYPHFLPCLVVSGYGTLCFLLTLVIFRETVKDAKKFWRRLSPFQHRSRCLEGAEVSRLSESVHLKGLLTFPILISGGNYVALALLDIMNSALLPLFCFSSPSNGGLGFPPSSIGYIMGSLGVTLGLFQFFFFAKILRTFGEKKVFIVAVTMFLFVFPLYGLISFVTQRWGLGAVTYALLGLLIAMLAVADLGFGAIFMFISSSPPNKRMVAATFGLCQAMASVIRAIGPAAATGIFSYSLTHHLLGGYLVYLIGFLLGLGALYLSLLLPHEVWPEPEQ